MNTKLQQPPARHQKNKPREDAPVPFDTQFDTQNWENNKDDSSSSSSSVEVMSVIDETGQPQQYVNSDQEEYQIESGFVEQEIGDAEYEAYLAKQKERAAADYESYLAQQQQAHARAPPLIERTEYYEEEAVASSYEEITASIYEEYTIGEASVDYSDREADEDGLMSVIPEENSLSNNSVMFDLSASDLVWTSPFAKPPEYPLSPSKSKQQQTITPTLPEIEEDEAPQTPRTGPGTKVMMKHCTVDGLPEEKRKALEGSVASTNAAATFTGMEFSAGNMHDVSPLTYHYQHTGTVLEVHRDEAPSLSPLTKPESFRYVVLPQKKVEKIKHSKKKDERRSSSPHKSKSHHHTHEEKGAKSKSHHHKDKDRVSSSSSRSKSRKKEESKPRKEKQHEPRKEKQYEPREEKESRSHKEKESRSKTKRTHDNNVGKKTISKSEKDASRSKTTSRREESSVDKKSVVKVDKNRSDDDNKRSFRKIEFKPRSKDAPALKAPREKLAHHSGVDGETIETELVTKRTATTKKSKSPESHKKRPLVVASKTKATASDDNNGSFSCDFSSDEEDYALAKKAAATTTKEHRQKSTSYASDGRRPRTSSSGTRPRHSTPTKKKSFKSPFDNATPEKSSTSASSKKRHSSPKKSHSSSKRSKLPVSSGNVESYEAGKSTRSSVLKSSEEAISRKTNEPDLTTEEKSIKSRSSKKSGGSKSKKSEKGRKEETSKKTKTEKSASSNKKSQYKKQKKQE